MEQELDSDIKIRKRKRRAVLSCNDCRRRKLKCDRELPCNRCINGGIAEECAYGQEDSLPTRPIPSQDPSRSDPSRSSSQVSVVSSGDFAMKKPDSTPKSTRASTRLTNLTLIDSKQGYIGKLEKQVAVLEKQLSALSRSSGHSSRPQEAQDLPDLLFRESLQPLTGLIKGDGYRTFAYGPTSPITIVVHFPQLRPFMKQVYPASSLGRVQDEVRVLEDRARASHVPGRTLSIPNLRSLLPDRATVDVLIKQYLDTFETTYRILHIPSFQSDYEIFWDTTPGLNPDLEAVVLAILACVLCTSTHETTRHNPNGSTFRSKAILWLKACDAWLKRHSNKHRTLASLQVRCLRLLALQTTCLKTKEFYQEVQTHMGFMRAIGMHRDPDIFKGRCTVFEAEMRRRLWATSLELELQASIDRGTPSILSSMEYDCAPPRNINDSELQLSMQELPPSKPLSVFTDTSFLHILMRSAELRIVLCAKTNSIRSTLDFQEVLRYQKEVQIHLDQLPQWDDARSSQAWTHLDLQLRQFLVILHTQRALQIQFRSNPDYRYSILTCLDSAVTLIERHIHLMDSGNVVLCCIRSDYYRAALIICHIAFHACEDSDMIVKRVAHSLFDDAIEKAMRLQEERSVRPGRGNKQLWYVSAACSLVRMKFDPDRAETLKHQAGDRVSKILYKILSLQDDPSEDYLANEVMLGNEPFSADAINAANGGLPPVTTGDGFTNSGLRLDGFDFTSTSEWVLDDFLFFNDLAPPIEFGNT